MNFQHSSNSFWASQPTHHQRWIDAKFGPTNTARKSGLIAPDGSSVCADSNGFYHLTVNVEYVVPFPHPPAAPMPAKQTSGQSLRFTDKPSSASPPLPRSRAMTHKPKLRDFLRSTGLNHRCETISRNPDAPQSPLPHVSLADAISPPRAASSSSAILLSTSFASSRKRARSGTPPTPASPLANTPTARRSSMISKVCRICQLDITDDAAIKRRVAHICKMRRHPGLESEAEMIEYLQRNFEKMETIDIGNEVFANVHQNCVLCLPEFFLDPITGSICGNTSVEISKRKLMACALCKCFYATIDCQVDDCNQSFHTTCTTIAWYLGEATMRFRSNRAIDSNNQFVQVYCKRHIADAPEESDEEDSENDDEAPDDEENGTKSPSPSPKATNRTPVRARSTSSRSPPPGELSTVEKGHSSDTHRTSQSSTTQNEPPPVTSPGKDASPIVPNGETGATTDQWECSKCTFANAMAKTKCAMCKTPRLPAASRRKSSLSSRFALR